MPTKLTNRLSALEGKASPPLVENWHHLVARGNETTDELIDAYGREKIGPNDSFIIFRSVAPRFDGEGNMIFFKDWPENQTSASGPKAT